MSPARQTFGTVVGPVPDAVVEVLAWNRDEALAYVDNVKVRVRRREFSILWKCARCGQQVNIATCPHAVAFAATVVPERENRDHDR